MFNLLVAQSGGPTAAINATLTGVIQAAQLNSNVDVVYGAVHGIEGVLKEKFVNLNEKVKDTSTMVALENTPSAALGSCRYKLKNPAEDPSEFEKIIDIFHKHNIGYFIYIGGNDSMDTVWKLSQYCKEKGIDDIKVIGAPKTIDNDLQEIDHCPGFGSAAKYIATTFAELERDIAAYETGGVLIVEIMGRNAGWLTASSALSRLNGGNGPDLIYLCERPFEMTDFLEDTKEILKEKGRVIVAVSEGLRDKTGKYLSDSVAAGKEDVFGHKYIAGAGRVLEDAVRNHLGCKVRSIELNLMQRCAAHSASLTDINESKLLGMKAVQCACDGQSGYMATLRRKSNTPYQIEISSVDISLVANAEKTVPLSWINDNGNDITDEMIEYLKPLVEGETTTIHENGIPKHIILI